MLCDTATFVMAPNHIKTPQNGWHSLHKAVTGRCKSQMDASAPLSLVPTDNELTFLRLYTMHDKTEGPKDDSNSESPRLNKAMQFSVIVFLPCVMHS